MRKNRDYKSKTLTARSADSVLFFGHWGLSVKRLLSTVCLGAVFVFSAIVLTPAAYAQINTKPVTANSESEIPVSSNTATNSQARTPMRGPISISANSDALQPETIGRQGGQYLDKLSPDQTQAAKNNRKGNRRNQWDVNTLTQSTGLGASSFYRAGQTVQTRPTANAAPSVSFERAIDALTTEDLLDVGELSKQIDEIMPTRSEGVVDLGSDLRGSLFNEASQDNVNGSVFRLGLDERLCLGTADECEANTHREIQMGYAKHLTHGKQGGFNLQLTPRAGVRFNENSKSALVGALVRIGDNLRDGASQKTNAWYLFAGADAETVRYSQPSLARQLTSGEFHLQDRSFVGDAQAGFGYRFGDADLSLTYFKRQTSGEDYRYDEDAAALSITWKR